MDEYLRTLERRYRSSESPQDGLALLQALLRSGSVILLDGFNQASWRAAGNASLRLDASKLELCGELLSETLARLLAEARRTPYRGPAQPLGATTPVPGMDAIYAILCRYNDDRPHQSTSMVGRPSYSIYLFTLTKTVGACQYCRVGYPHDCEAFVHPASNGQVISVEHEECTDEDPLLIEAYELDPPIKRTWYPTQEAPRRMEVTVHYHLNRWVFSSVIDAGTTPTPWRLINNLSAGDFNDAADVEYIVQMLPRSFKDYNASHPGYGPPSRSQEKDCLVIFDKLSETIPQISPHQPLEQPPTLLTEACEEFEVIPGGQVITEMVRGQMRLVKDNTTTCGHGYISRPQFIPLCPPRWSDGEQAGWRCNSCAKLLGMEAGRPGDLIMCKVCRLKARLEEDADGPRRVRFRSFRCPCSEKFSSLEEALECCGEQESEIDIRDRWAWDYDND